MTSIQPNQTFRTTFDSFEELEQKLQEFNITLEVKKHFCNEELISKEKEYSYEGEIKFKETVANFYYPPAKCFSTIGDYYPFYITGDFERELTKALSKIMQIDNQQETSITFKDKLFISMIICLIVLTVCFSVYGLIQFIKNN